MPKKRHFVEYNKNYFLKRNLNDPKRLKSFLYEKKISCMLWNIDNNIPGEFITFIHYCRNLDYDETPNYAYLCNLLKNLFALKKFSVESLV